MEKIRKNKALMALFVASKFWKVCVVHSPFLLALQQAQKDQAFLCPPTR